MPSVELLNTTIFTGSSYAATVTSSPSSIDSPPSPDIDDHLPARVATCAPIGLRAARWPSTRAGTSRSAAACRSG